MFKPTSLKDFPITVPAHRKRLEDILNGRLTFPAHGIDGICLYGHFGTGKTTLAKLLPLLLEHAGHLPKNWATGSPAFAPLSSRKGGAISLVRCGTTATLTMLQAIEKTLDASPSLSQSGYHYVIFDEAQGLKAQAMRPMRAIMSASDQAIFVFTTNDYPSLDPGIQSRCYEVEMNWPDLQSLIGVGNNILRGMGLTLDAAIVAQIAEQSRDYRQFGSELEAAARDRGDAP